jgi:hypothetical protein
MTTPARGARRGRAARTRGLAACGLVAAGTALAVGGRGPVPLGPDRYGYRMVDATSPDCAFGWVDAATGGELLALAPAGTAPAHDEGGAVVTLAAPFEFYGAPADAWVVSSNVYLAAAASLGADNGGDFAADAVLPAIPGLAPGVPARIAVWHDDAAGESGAVYQRHFPTCPRPSEALGSEPCTVVAWEAWSRAGGGAPLDAEVVLYHASFEIVLQIRPGGVTLAGGTVGIQDATASDALQYRPELGLDQDTAVCLFEPRFPAGGPLADLEITNAAKSDEPLAPGQVAFSIGVQNRGPSPVAVAHVAVALAPFLVDCTWTCTASAGSSCAPAGASPIDVTVALAPAGWADYAVVCTATPDSGELAATATVAPPAGVADPVPANNAATAVVATVAGVVPSGAGGSEPLRLAKEDGELRLVWGASCLASDVDYAAYAGPLGAFAAHAPLACSTNGARDLAVPAAGGDTYYLVVPTNLLFEGGYGVDGAGAPRPPAAAACYPPSPAACP